MTKELTIDKKTKIDKVVAMALRTIYTDNSFNRFHKEAIIAIFCQYLKEYDCRFSEYKFRKFITGR